MKILRICFASFAMTAAINVALADNVIYDDLIVDGSACVGFDCVNGESFGFDTIRLKENNLRIKFDDTSVAASYPRNDWQLTANASANGGQEKFSIDDISGGRTPFTVEANARSHSLYVDDGGRIGSRTSTPSLEIHTIDGDTPSLRLQQDGSSGFAPQTWDVAGNETNFFIRDVTNGSTLPFRIRPSAPTSSIFIDVDGDIGMGTSSPGAQLHINRSGVVLSTIQSSDNDATQLRFKTNSTNRRIVAVDGSDGVETQIVMGDSGDVDFLGATAADEYVNISSAGLNVNGAISLNGSQIHPDYVFEPTYKLATIEDQAKYMFGEKHLPAVGAGTYDEQGRSVLDIGKKTMGMLEELEKAHLYIVQLNDRLKKIEQSNIELREQVAKMQKDKATSGDENPKL
jgi:hypothetical protein